jgi:PBP superfamily domain
MTNQRLRIFRAIGGALIAGTITVAVASPSSGATTAIPQQFVSLQGEGAWSITSELVSWQNELATASPWINLNYVKHGSFLGRQDLIAKDVDFAISGVSFTAAEVAHVQGGASAFIDAPIQVATLATFVEPPAGGFQAIVTRCDPDDPTTWPPDVTDGSTQCILKSPYTGAVRIPSQNLGAMFLHYPFGGFPPLPAWNNPDILQAFGVPQIATGGPTAAPGYAGRSDPDEINYYLQTFVKTAAPDVWQGNKQLNPNVPWDPITERLGQVAGVTRDGAEQQLAQLVQGGCGVTGLCANDVAGGVAPAPPSMLQEFRGAFAKQPISLAELQNANGDWVAPTAAAIDKAVDAGGDAPLFALTHKVPGAYPLVWVDHLYAPAHGLSIDKTEGLAMTIRYLATTGQEKEGLSGEGRLPVALVKKALAAADELVASNCTGADRQIFTTSDPGPLAPATATAMRSIGPMLHCEAAAAPTTSTVAAPNTTTSVRGPSSTSPSTVTPAGRSFATAGPGAVATNPSVVGSTKTPTTVAGSTPAVDTSGGTGAEQGSVLLTASKLPLPQPGGASGTDRLATFLLGAFLYLIARKPLSRLVRRISS